MNLDRNPCSKRSRVARRAGTPLAQRSALAHAREGEARGVPGPPNPRSAPARSSRVSGALRNTCDGAARPDATPEEILEAGLDALIQAKRAKRWGDVKKPRKVPPPSTREDVFPAHVKRAIHERAGGRCEFLLPNGERCGETKRLEIDHVEPVALGGRSTFENGRLACRPHNDGAARAIFGGAWMDRFTGRRKRTG